MDGLIVKNGRLINNRPEWTNKSGLEVAAEMKRYYTADDVYDNPGEDMERAKQMGCDGIPSHEENGKTINVSKYSLSEKN